MVWPMMLSELIGPFRSQTGSHTFPSQFNTQSYHSDACASASAANPAGLDRAGPRDYPRWASVEDREVEADACSCG